jgi:spermidine synthase
MNPRGTQILAEFIDCSEELLRNSDSVERILTYGIEQAGFHLISLSSHQFSPGGATVVAIIGESHIAIHTYPEARHATIDIFTCSSDHDQRKLLNILQEELAPKTVRVMEVQRGNPLEITDSNWMTEFSTKGFDVRYHVQKEILNTQSKYQKIKIIENDNFGRMLFLDHDLQVSERDAPIYNAALVDPFVRKNRKLGAVLILGGGDGGVLHELLRHDPQRVVLVDIDEEVIRASQKYLPGICNGGFHHPRVEVVIDDANEYLKTSHEFDSIVYDLTMHPESFTDKDRATYLDEMFSTIRKGLGNHGMVSMQCCSEFDTETLELAKNLLSRHFKNVSFTKIFVPCFCENWVFAAAEAG